MGLDIRVLTDVKLIAENVRRHQILMGYKGDSYMDSGYFYCPYVPLTQTPVVLDPESFCPRKGILTRSTHGMLCVEHRLEIFTWVNDWLDNVPI